MTALEGVQEIPWLAPLAAAAAILGVVLVATSRWWLAAVLGWLDAVLTRLGVGTWAARALTWLEERAAARAGKGGREAP